MFIYLYVCVHHVSRVLRFFLHRREALVLMLHPHALVSLVFTLRLRCANAQLFLSLLLSLFPYSPSSSFHSSPLRGSFSVSLSLSFFISSSLHLSLSFSNHPHLAFSSVSFVGAQIKSLFLPSFRERRALAPFPSQRLFLPLPKFLH